MIADPRAALVPGLLLACLSCAWAAPAEGLPCAVADKPCLLEAGRNHEVRKAAYWKPTLALPVAERIGPAPPKLLEYLLIDNALNGFAQKPLTSKLADDFLADVRGAIADLPPAVRRVFNDTFAGVWFVDDLGGTGYTDIFVDGDENPVGGYIILDAALLGKFTANTWATWKESSPFKPDKLWTLEAKIEEPASDNRRGAIRYILLHELGHVLSINRDVHPRWDVPPEDVPASERFPFFDLSWTINRRTNNYASRFDRDFTARGAVIYYRGSGIGAIDMMPIYRDLARTNFPTLYAATSPAEDFADAFVNYVHTVLMKRPWEITIRHEGKVAFTYGSCWQEPRCAPKRRILEDLLR